jgi:DNA-binding NtrC family response regulator
MNNKVAFVLEDQEMFSGLIVNILEKQGLESDDIFTFRFAEKAMELLPYWQPGLAIIDINLAGTATGWDFLKQYHRECGDKAKGIIYSGNDSSVVRFVAEERGAFTFISKGNAKELSRAIQAALSDKAA